MKQTSFRLDRQQDARDVSERYIAKSNPWIIMISTPNAPEGLFERIEREAEDSCLYKRLYLDYSYGLDRIYTTEEIEQAKASPSFERRVHLKYLGLIGNVFHTKDIDGAIQRGEITSDNGRHTDTHAHTVNHNDKTTHISTYASSSCQSSP